MTKADRGLFYVAEKLGIPVGQVLEMTAAEYLGWINLHEVDKEMERIHNFENLRARLRASQ